MSSKKNDSVGSGREFWQLVNKVAREVSEWPEWKKGGKYSAPVQASKAGAKIVPSAVEDSPKPK
ncbi:MAG: hypothetical protein AMXMBFR7_46500 [Planctomycetota bacterium]